LLSAVKISPKYIDLFLVLVIVVSLTVAGMEFAKQNPAPVIQHEAPAPKTTDELRQQIEKVLKKTHTPGVGLAIVKRAGPEWVAGIGLADVAANKPVTPETLFRIGSVSKGFVSLSVLKLQEEGKLGLQDTLKSRAPDLEFANPWEATDPIRIVNLLEHTTGWDDLALREFAYNPTKELTLQEGLAYDPKSRTSRWKPGTRYAYTNAGPAAAAYVVEKVTGQRFEDYVEQNWFKPLRMDTAGYFDTPQIQSRLTKLYHLDGQTPYPYWHFIMRPAASINASAKEMANYVQFYLNRGSFGGVQLLPPGAIDRMEEPTSTSGAREGLKTGYGLGNRTVIRNRWQYHGHDGAVPGGLTELAYLPDAGVGYVIMINSGNSKALVQIGHLIQTYITRALTKPALPPATTVSLKLMRNYAGWYEPISPRIERMRFQLRILGLTKIIAREGGLSLHGLSGEQQNYVAVTDQLFRRDTEPIPTLAFIADKSEGMLIQASGQTLRRVPAWLPWLELSVMAAAILLMMSSLVFALVWMPRKMFGCMRAVGCLSVRALPLLATLSMVGALVLRQFLGEDVIARLGQVTPWSVGLFGSSLAFAVFAVLGVAQALRFRNREIRRWVWWHSFVTSAVLTIVAMYLAYWGVIGWRAWA
jgi:CubicO group peptidase (beta-lactamase class C family)